MARKQHNELTAGIFTIVGVILLVGVVFWLGAADVFQSSSHEAWFFVELGKGEQGLKPGALVKINDVEVGKIAEVHLDLPKGKTFYKVKLFDGLFDEKTKIKKDADTRVNAALVGGGAVLQILDCGKGPSAVDRTNAAEIKPGAFTAAVSDAGAALTEFKSLSSQAKGMMQTLTDEMNKDRDGSTLHKMHAIMDKLEDSLASIKNELDAGNKNAVIAKIHQTIQDISEIAADAKPRIKSVMTGVEAIIASAKPKVDDIFKTVDQLFSDAGKLVNNADNLVAGANELIDEFNKLAKGEIAETITKIHEASKSVVKIAGDFAKVSEGAKDIVAMNGENIDEIIDNMGQVASNLKAASKEIRRSPWRLLYRPKKDEIHSQNIHDAARSFSAGASQLDQALAKLKGLAEANPNGVPANDPQLKKIAEQIKKTFEKFTDAEKALWKELLK